MLQTGNLYRPKYHILMMRLVARKNEQLPCLGPGFLRMMSGFELRPLKNRQNARKRWKIRENL
jgi:hypothetical protein